MIDSQLKVNADKTHQKQRSKLTDFFPMRILSQTITPAALTQISRLIQTSILNTIIKTICCCFDHICGLRRIYRYISLYFAKAIVTAHASSKHTFSNPINLCKVIIKYLPDKLHDGLLYYAYCLFSLIRVDAHPVHGTLSTSNFDNSSSDAQQTQSFDLTINGVRQKS